MPIEMKRWSIASAILFLATWISWNTHAQRQKEYLDRGVVAVPSGEGVLVSWRLLGTDPETIKFDVYKIEGEGEPVKLNGAPLDQSSNFLDKSGSGNGKVQYFVRAYEGTTLLDESSPLLAWDKPYLSIPQRTPGGYTPNDASIGDLTGDGRYEIVVHMTGVGKDNSHKGITD
jgi:rhamnogalacturonan endolyase